MIITAGGKRPNRTTRQWKKYLKAMFKYANVEYYHIDKKCWPGM